MHDVLVTLWQATLVCAGACWWLVSYAKKADEKDRASFAAWLRRPLRDPPPTTDWEAFEARIAGDPRGAGAAGAAAAVTGDVSSYDDN